MNCPITEEQLALYAGSDLSPKETAAVAEHVHECPACRDTLADLERSLQLLAHDYAVVDLEDLRSVRERVIQEIGTRRQHTRLLRISAIAAALTAIVLAPILLEHKAPQRRPPIAVSHPPTLPVAPVLRFDPPPTVQPVTVHRLSHRRKTAPGLRAVTLHMNPDGTSEFKIATADPNVTILLATNGNTHEN